MTVQSKAADVIFRIRQYSTESLTPDWYCGCSLGDGKYAMITLPAPFTHCKDSLTICDRHIVFFHPSVKKANRYTVIKYDYISTMKHMTLPAYELP